MNVQLLFFGITKDLVQLDDLSFKVSHKSTVGSLKKQLQDVFPQLTRLDSYFIAVNESYAGDEVLLKENDKVAILPPVSGG